MTVGVFVAVTLGVTLGVAVFDGVIVAVTLGVGVGKGHVPIEVNVPLPETIAIVLAQVLKVLYAETCTVFVNPSQSIIKKVVSVVPPSKS